MTAYESALAAIAARRELLAAGTPGPWVENVLGSEGYEVRGPLVARSANSRILRRPRVARCGYEEWETDKANAALIVAATNAFAADTDALEAVLLRHAPRMAGSRGPFCFACHTVTVASAPHWPCPDAQAALTALGIDPNGETP